MFTERIVVFYSNRILCVKTWKMSMLAKTNTFAFLQGFVMKMPQSRRNSQIFFPYWDSISIFRRHNSFKQHQWPWWSHMSYGCVCAPTNDSLGSIFSFSESSPWDAGWTKDVSLPPGAFRCSSWYSCRLLSSKRDFRALSIFFLISSPHLSFSESTLYLFSNIPRQHVPL